MNDINAEIVLVLEKMVKQSKIKPIVIKNEKFIVNPIKDINLTFIPIKDN